MSNEAKRLLSQFPTDVNGHIISDISMKRYDISGDVAAGSVFTGNGVIQHITIWKDVDNGTIQLTDVNGTAITPAAITDYGGSFTIKQLVINGCKVTTTGFTGGLASVYYTD